MSVADNSPRPNAFAAAGAAATPFGDGAAALDALVIEEAAATAVVVGEEDDEREELDRQPCGDDRGDGNADAGDLEVGGDVAGSDAEDQIFVRPRVPRLNVVRMNFGAGDQDEASHRAPAEQDIDEERDGEKRDDGADPPNEHDRMLRVVHRARDNTDAWRRGVAGVEGF